MISKELSDRLIALARKAKPISDDDWGSDRQIDAESELYRDLLKVFGSDSMADLEDKSMAHKATVDESLDNVIEFIKSQTK